MSDRTTTYRCATCPAVVTAEEFPPGWLSAGGYEVETVYTCADCRTPPKPSSFAETLGSAIALGGSFKSPLCTCDHPRILFCSVHPEIRPALTANEVADHYATKAANWHGAWSDLRDCLRVLAAASCMDGATERAKGMADAVAAMALSVAEIEKKRGMGA